MLKWKASNATDEGKAKGVHYMKIEERDSMASVERCKLAGASSTGLQMGKAVGNAVGFAVGRAKGKGTSLTQMLRNKSTVKCPCGDCEFVFRPMRKERLYSHLISIKSTDAIAHFEYFSPRSHNELPEGMTVKWFSKVVDGREEKLTFEEWMAKNKRKSRAKGS